MTCGYCGDPINETWLEGIVAQAKEWAQIKTVAVLCVKCVHNTDEGDQITRWVIGTFQNGTDIIMQSVSDAEECVLQSLQELPDGSWKSKKIATLPVPPTR